MKKHKMKTENIGSNFDDFLQDEGILNKTDAIAIKRVIAWQIKQIGNESSQTHQIGNGKKCAQPRRTEPPAR